MKTISVPTQIPWRSHGSRWYHWSEIEACYSKLGLEPNQFRGRAMPIIRCQFQTPNPTVACPLDRYFEILISIRYTQKYPNNFNALSRAIFQLH